jgi:hypothetical protein
MQLNLIVWLITAFSAGNYRTESQEFCDARLLVQCETQFGDRSAVASGSVIGAAF